MNRTAAQHDEWVRELEESTVEELLRQGRLLPTVPRDFTHSCARVRMDWDSRVKSLTSREFKRTYRISNWTFNEVLEVTTAPDSC